MSIEEFLRKSAMTINEIKPKRMEKLDVIARMIKKDVQHKGLANVVFVCTHNSRRSQFAEVALSLCLRELNMEQIETYSCGTEETRIAQPVVDLLKTYDMEVSEEVDKENPIVSLDYEGWSKKLFSKTYEYKGFEDKEFVAVMVCDDAAENCPFVPRFVNRIPHSYIDPKRADGTDLQEKRYSQTFSLILQEMMYLALKIED